MAYYEYMHRCYMYPEQEYLPKFLKHLPKEFQDTESYNEVKIKFQELKDNGKLTEKIKNKLKEASEELNVIGEEQLFGIDKFWRDFADELGVVYKTNYEWLT